MYRKYLKRLIDLLLAAVGLLILAIPMMIIAAVIKLDSPGPVVFTQKRVGIHKTYFNILKFRSMPMGVDHDVPTHQFSDADALTPWQRFMRRSSIDELPQLINILRGDMSIVGPRPALWNQFDLVEERERYGANDVQPGLTGWAQINGRDELEIPVKAKFDGEYVQKMGFLFDCKCFFGTFLKVLRHDGVVEGGKALEEKQKVNNVS